MRNRAFWALSCVVLLTGCANQDMSDLQRFVEQVKAREPEPIEPLPELKQIETFAYEAGERRSPFEMGGAEAQQEIAINDSVIKPDIDRRREELEQFPLDSIRMVGTIEQQEDTWALVTIKDGTLFRIRSGNYLGQNHGQVVRIAEDRIELQEIVPDGMGGWQERQASIALSE